MRLNPVSRDAGLRWRGAIGVWIGGAILLALGTPVGAAVIQKTEVDVVVDPNSESMTVRTRLHIVDNAGDEELVCYFLKPARMDYLREVDSGRDVPYTLENVSRPEYGVSVFTMAVGRSPEECVLELAYAYTDEVFYGYSLNPSTLDNLVLGQLTQESAYSSHLFYYPFPGLGTGTGRIAITVPEGWIGVSAGILESQEDLEGGLSRFTYDIPYASGLLVFPLAVYPYVVEETLYRDRVPVSIYCAAEDVSYAREKMEHVTTKVLPFLEELMGDYPWPNLRIVEVFPNQGNTGLAAKGLVMMSQTLWFAASIGDDYLTLPSIILSDEIAHQWNFYRLQLPNFLAEGVSEYTDNLFQERFVGAATLAANMAAYRDAYIRIVNLMNRLKSLKESGASVEQAAASVGLSVADVAPFWPYVQWGELPITDPRVFPTLYFIKGALAIHALRRQIGDAEFFAGFKKLFTDAGDEPVTLDYFRQCFETVHGGSLAAFFLLWYYGTGLPAEGPIQEPVRRRHAVSRDLPPRAESSQDAGAGRPYHDDVASHTPSCDT